MALLNELARKTGIERGYQEDSKGVGQDGKTKRLEDDTLFRSIRTPLFNGLGTTYGTPAIRYGQPGKGDCNCNCGSEHCISGDYNRAAGFETVSFSEEKPKVKGITVDVKKVIDLLKKLFGGKK